MSKCNGLLNALLEISEMSSWQIGVPVDTEAANEHARIAQAMADIARNAVSMWVEEQEKDK